MPLHWKKGKLPLGFNGESSHDIYEAISDKGYYVQVINAGIGVSDMMHRESLCHWVLAFVKAKRQIFTRGEFFEPSYQQKLMVLREVGKWKNIALEVMPPEPEVVDREDVYHLWEFEYPYSFIHNYKPILEGPDSFGEEFANIEYHISTVGEIRYLYFRSKNPNSFIGWRKKQNLKNHAIGFNDTAIEIITEEMSDKQYGCLICLPHNQYLDFTLL